MVRLLNLVVTSSNHWGLINKMLVLARVAERHLMCLAVSDVLLVVSVAPACALMNVGTDCVGVGTVICLADR